MKRNRLIPFGYRIENGEVLVHPIEAEAVVLIFTEYLNGNSMSRIAEILTVPYSEKRAWKQPVIHQILTNKTYLGTEKYPHLITEDMFREVTRLRQSKGYTSHRIPEELSVLRSLTYCKECEHRLERIGGNAKWERWSCHNKECSKFSYRLTDQMLKNAVIRALNTVITTPDMLDVTVEPNYSPTPEIKRQQNEIRRMMDDPTVDYDRIKEELFHLAAMKYDTCLYSGAPQNTEHLKALLAEQPELHTLAIGLLKSCVRRISVSHFCTIEVEFQNGAVINERGERV